MTANKLAWSWARPSSWSTNVQVRGLAYDFFRFVSRPLNDQIQEPDALLELGDVRLMVRSHVDNECF